VALTKKQKVLYFVIN